MPLPSSAPINRLSVGVQGPDINLAAFTPNVKDQQDALERGFQLGQNINDSIVLRPAILDAQRKQAELAGMQADSGKNLVSAQEANTRGRLDVENQVNSTTQTSAEQTQKDLTDPGWRLRAAHAQVVALTDDSQQAAQAIVDAHATGDDKAIESAIKKKAAVDKDLSAYQSRLNLLVANQTAAEAAAKANAAGAQRGEIIAKGGLNQAPTDAETNLLRSAAENSGAENTATAAGDFVAKRAAVTKAISDAVTAGGQAQVTAAPFSSEPVLQSMEEGARANAAASALTSKANLAMVAQQIASGGYASAITPELDSKIREDANKLGVPIFQAGGGKRPLADVSADYAKASNVEEAKAPMAIVNKDAEIASDQLNRYKRLQELLGTNAPTGYLFGIAAHTGLDQIAAQMGNTNAEIRRQIDAIQNSLIPDATRGLGRMTAPDIALFQKALPGSSNTPTTNANLVAASVALDQRDLDKQKFYSSLVGPLKIGAVDSLWNSYIQSNPFFDHAASTSKDVVLNKFLLPPEQYVKLLESSPQQIGAFARQLANNADPSQLRPGNSAADIAAAPDTDPFLSAMGPRGELRTVANPKYWSKIENLSSSVRKQEASVAPATPSPVFMKAMTSPVEDFIRPLGTQQPVSSGALVPRQ